MYRNESHIQIKKTKLKEKWLYFLFLLKIIFPLKCAVVCAFSSLLNS